MSQYNKAANFVAENAFKLKIANKYQLQRLLYRKIRELFNLSAQFAIRVINKVVEAYRRDIRIKPVSESLGLYSMTSEILLGRTLTVYQWIH